MKITFYKKNKAPVLEFIRALEVKERAKILACLKSIEDLGLSTPRVQFRQIKNKLWEIKINAFKNNYRIFYVMITQKTLVLLHIYKKKTQKTPENELKIAEKRLLEVLKNEGNHTH